MRGLHWELVHAWAIYISVKKTTMPFTKTFEIVIECVIVNPYTRFSFHVSWILRGHLLNLSNLLEIISTRKLSFVARVLNDCNLLHIVVIIDSSIDCFKSEYSIVSSLTRCCDSNCFFHSYHPCTLLLRYWCFFSACLQLNYGHCLTSLIPPSIPFTKMFFEVSNKVGTYFYIIQIVIYHCAYAIVPAYRPHL